MHSKRRAPNAWQGIRLAAGELTLRVTEERRRRDIMLRDVGSLPEARMRGEIGGFLVSLLSDAYSITGQQTLHVRRRRPSPAELPSCA